MSPGDFSLPANGYVIDGESGAELARLLNQDHQLWQIFREKFSNRYELAPAH